MASLHGEQLFYLVHAKNGKQSKQKIHSEENISRIIPGDPAR